MTTPLDDGIVVLGSGIGTLEEFMENVAKYPTLLLNTATDRFERRLSEELGGLRSRTRAARRLSSWLPS